MRLRKAGIKSFVVVLLGCNVASVFAQSEPKPLAAILGEEILAPGVSLFQLKEYLLKRVAKPPAPTSAQQWTTEARQLRERLLRVAFNGWPNEWVNSSPKFEDLGIIKGGVGFRMRKLRYEIVPGFQSTAILYEPEKLDGKGPAILNVNGHVGAPGKSIEYKQKRCINFAKQGILALNLEWLSFGELTHKENEHWFGAHLDLVGANELGLFILAMRRGLDYLYQHPNTDRSRLGMTGLSGGGWQTIVLSSLDERVTAAVPVAGFSSFVPRIEASWSGDLGDVEQSATDVFDGQDYTHLAAMMAPRPMLLTYNAEDDCCFRAPLVKPFVYDFLKPIYKLYGKEGSLLWHENSDPGNHNYQLDNRLQTYRFFSQQFKLPLVEKEIPSDTEIKSYEELVVGLPNNNLTTLGLARKLSGEIRRQPIPADAPGQATWAGSERQKLKAVVRYKPTDIRRAWAVANTKSKGVETKSFLFSFENGLSANAVWARAIGAPENAPVTIVVHDEGKKAAGIEVSDRVNRGDQVLAVDLVFTGDAWRKIESSGYEQILHGTGDRPLGLEAAQLLTVTRWICGQSGNSKVRVESRGIRNQVAVLVASALQPELFSEVVIREGMSSLAYLLEKPVEFDQAPELFCFDLYKQFDLDRLAALATPARVRNEQMLRNTAK
jgi:dienelactone hydrolase